MSKYHVIFFFIFCTNIVFAQIGQFNHVFNQPLLLNPAYTGTIESSRFIVNTRRQWPEFSSERQVRFDTYSVSYDQFFPKHKIAVGMMLSHDKAGDANLQSNVIGLLGAYEFEISNETRVRFSLQGDYAMMDVNFTGLLFEDQILTQNPISQENLVGTDGKVNYFDFSFGSLMSTEIYWVGLAIHHLNQPNISLIDEKVILPTKLTIHGGLRFPLNMILNKKGSAKGPLLKKGSTKKDNPNNGLDKEQLRIATIYQRTGNVDQLSLGIIFEHHISAVKGQKIKPYCNNPENNTHIGLAKENILSSFNAGLWYNAISFSNKISVNHHKVDPLVFRAGFHFLNFPISSIVYSYDLPFFSQLDTSTGGAHALSIRFQLGHVSDCPDSENWEKHRGYYPIMDAR
ncbi:PorP/SprF family type IX secretion system membrane protein [Fulvivirgaceae bacterium BMA12]|uniref:PorP/SprF family type IX secretion system membrane protein n=1 Tax=Agaribacillus aureus TaxID=3051825 RepID=A0ABT8LAB1_9BACT|nr:PorP/SprF family type IX secretion system membrane protein [Fulvivirgaceae bacterium BMA12]